MGHHHYKNINGVSLVFFMFIKVIASCRLRFHNIKSFRQGYI